MGRHSCIQAERVYIRLNYLSLRISDWLTQYAKTKDDLVLNALLGVYFDEYNVFQPDIIYVQKSNKSILQDKVNGAPGLIVEVISPSNSYVDRYHKKEIYQRYKVQEYWIVDPGNQSVEIYSLKDDTYILFAYQAIEGTANSVLLNLSINLKEIF